MRCVRFCFGVVNVNDFDFDGLAVKVTRPVYILPSSLSGSANTTAWDRLPVCSTGAAADIFVSWTLDDVACLLCRCNVAQVNDCQHSGRRDSKNKAYVVDSLLFHAGAIVETVI